MNTEHPSDRDQRLGEILAAHLEAVEAGHAPDREALLAQHPELAAELVAFFANEGQLAAFVRPRPNVPEGNPATAPGHEAPLLVPGAGEPGDPGARTVRYFGDYELSEEIARGGMGVVWKARQVSLNRPVALKMILAGQWATPEARQRFRAEAEAAANLQHPNIVAIHEVGEHEGQPYFTMDFV